MFEDSARRLRRLVDGADQRIRAAFDEAIGAAKSSRTLDDIADLLNQGRLGDALEAAAAAGSRIAAEIAVSYLRAAGSTASFLSSGLEVVIEFDRTNLRAVGRLRNARLNFIREFSATQREATREALTEAVTSGLGPRAQARAFRSSIGLTRHQVRAVDNFRRLLRSDPAQALTRDLRDRRFDATVRNAARGDAVLTDRQIDRMVERYRDRFLKFRSETIARTESLRAVHEGHREMIDQAIDNGDIRSDQLQQTWITAGDERVRGTAPGDIADHVALDGVSVGINEVWETALGPLRFPGDPLAAPANIIQCRCVVTTRITEL